MNDRDGDVTLDQFTVTLPASPYPGLRPFDRHEWPIFFGRERMSDAVVSRLVREQFLVVHGDSGCGKSSLIRAGVLPRLEQENARGGLTWRTTISQPRNAPLQLLAEALAGLDGRQGDESRVTEVRRVLNFGAEAPRALAAMLRRGDADHLCVLIDQFEEIFAFARRGGSADASLFVQILVALLEQPPQGFYAVVTMRSEFLGACAHFPGLAEAVNRAQYLLPRMGHGDLTRAIREPASLYGGEITPELTDRLILDSGGSQDQLPLIQHGLMLLHRLARRRAPDAAGWRIGLDEYNEVGDLTDSLSSHADEVLASADTDPFPLAEKLFRALTEINADGQAVRRPRTVAQLAAVSGADPAAVVRFVDAFRAEGASFLTPFGAGPIDVRTLVDISHESLIRCWRRIASAKTGWLGREFQDGLIWRSLLVQAESYERNAELLLSLSTAEEQEQWLTDHNPVWTERYGGGWDRVQRLVQASLAAGRAARRQEQARARRWQYAQLGFGGFLVLVAFALLWLNSRTNDALARANEASAASLWNRLDFANPERILDDELNALWEVRLGDPAVRASFTGQLASQDDRVDRLGRRPLPILRALYLQWGPDRAAAVRDAVLRRAGRAADTERLIALAPAVQATAASMTGAEARDLFRRYLQVLGQLNETTPLGPQAGTLNALAERVESAEAAPLLKESLDTVASLADATRGFALAGAAATLAGRMPSEQVDATLSSVLESVPGGGDTAVSLFTQAERELLASLRDVPSVNAVVSMNELMQTAPRISALEMLAARLPASQVGARLTRTLDDMEATESPALRSALAVVAQGLSGRATEADAGAALIRVVARGQATAPDRLIANIVALTAILGERATAEAARAAAAPLLKELTTKPDARRGARLNVILQPLLPGLSPGEQRIVLSQAVRSLSAAGNIADIDALATIIGSYGGILGHEENVRVVPALIAAARHANSVATAESFAAAAARTAAQLTSAECESAIRALFTRIRSSVEAGELAALSSMLTGLATGLSQADAARLLPDLWGWMTATADVAQLRALSFAVPALAGRLAADDGRRSLPGCMRYLMGTRDPDQIGALALAARTLADLLPIDERAAALAPLQGMLDAETDPDRLARMSSVIPPLAPGLTPDEANALFNKVALAMGSTLYAEQLRSLKAAADAVSTKVTAEEAATMISTIARMLAVASDFDRIDALTAAAAVLGTRVEPSKGDVLRTLIGWAATPDQAVAAARALVARPSSESADDRIASLVEILKYPTGAGSPTRVILETLHTANAGAPGPDAGLDANLAWVAKTYPGLRLDRPPACPPPVIATQTCPSDGPRTSLDPLESAAGPR